jgi:hypothetical protein
MNKKKKKNPPITVPPALKKESAMSSQTRKRLINLLRNLTDAELERATQEILVILNRAHLKGLGARRYVLLDVPALASLRPPPAA